MSGIDPPFGFVSKASVLEELTDHGATISESKLERWRSQGLLPPLKQIGLGQGLGSVTFYPKDTARQAMEINRLLSVKRKLCFVGFELWWLGYEVGEKYWKPLLIDVSKMWCSAVLKLTQLLHKVENDDDFDGGISEPIPATVLPTPLKGRVRNLSKEDLDDAIRVLIESTTGNFSEFYVDHASDKKESQKDAVQNMLGFTKAKTHAINGNKIMVHEALPLVFKTISETKFSTEINDAFFESKMFDKLLLARNEIRGIFTIIRNTHEAFSWVYGPRSFGLKLARWFSDKSPASVRILIALLWMDVRDTLGNDFLNRSKIDRLLLDSKKFLSDSNRLKVIVESNPELRKIYTLKRLKLAFSEPEKFQVLCNELKFAQVK